MTKKGKKEYCERVPLKTAYHQKWAKIKCKLIASLQQYLKGGCNLHNQYIPSNTLR